MPVTSCRCTSVLIGAALLAASCASVPVATGEKPPVEMYGEIHGTKEIPANFEKLVRENILQNNRILVGIELTQSEIDGACSALKNSTQGKSEMLGWRGKTQDGRYSLAMATMVCNLSGIKGVTPFPMISDNGSALRDNMISQSIVDRSDSTSKIMVLTGNFHSRNADSSAAGIVRNNGIKVSTFVYDARNRSQAWICTQEDKCGPTDIGARFCSSDEELSVDGILLKETAGSRWDKCISLPQITPSSPAAVAQ
jgi:hypothetical protein